MFSLDNRIRVGIFYGGRSAECNVSQASASTVVHQLDSTKFEAIPIHVAPNGEWFNNELQRIDHFSLFYSEQRLFDIAFPLIHGPTGEDGVLQGFLEFSGYPYIGPGVLSSAIGIDKYVSKSFLQMNNIPVVKHLLIKKQLWIEDPLNMIARIEETLPYPIVVKPTNSGSSFGVHWVESNSKLQEAINDAFSFGANVIIEEAINAREIYVGILEKQDGIMVSEPGEVLFAGSLFSQNMKQNAPHLTKIQVPAELSAEQYNQVKDLAVTIFDLLQCEGIARVDLFLDNDSGAFIFNEINTIPGFTPGSIYPKLFSESGLTITQLLTDLIEYTLYKHNQDLQ